MEREYPLGKASASGADADAQCIHFTGLIRAKVGRETSGVNLKMINSEVIALCDMKAPGAEQWAMRALGHAPRIWNEVIHGKGIIR